MEVDVVVVGLGGMGLATCYSLIERNLRVLGIEQFQIGHSLASSSGKTRLFRTAYFQEPQYIPLLKKTYLLWKELEKRGETSFFHEVGVLHLIHPSQSNSFEKLVEARQKEYSLSIEKIEGAAKKKLFPAYSSFEGFLFILEKEAGILEAEKILNFYKRQILKKEGVLFLNKNIEQILCDKREYFVLVDGIKIKTKKIIFTVGAWACSIFSHFTKNISLEIKRIPQFWFKEKDRKSSLSSNLPALSPCFFATTEQGSFFGFPPLVESNVKIASFDLSKDSWQNPFCVPQEVFLEEREIIEKFVRAYFPFLSPTPVSSSVGICTFTSDENFRIGSLLENPDWIFATGFSGHGFKFLPSIADLLADLVEGKKLEKDQKEKENLFLWNANQKFL